MKIKSIIPIVALATVSMTSVAQNPQSQQLRSGLDMSNMDNSHKTTFSITLVAVG